MTHERTVRPATADAEPPSASGEAASTRVKSESRSPVMQGFDAPAVRHVEAMAGEMTGGMNNAWRGIGAAIFKRDDMPQAANP